jgi:hypothetical protein
MGSIQDLQAPVKPSRSIFKHGELGTIVGWERQSNIVQFRGVPYATIPGRFRQSVRRRDLPCQPFLATSLGMFLFYSSCLALASWPMLTCDV